MGSYVCLWQTPEISGCATSNQPGISLSNEIIMLHFKGEWNNPIKCNFITPMMIMMMMIITIITIPRPKPKPNLNSPDSQKISFHINFEMSLFLCWCDPNSICNVLKWPNIRWCDSISRCICYCFVFHVRSAIFHFTTFQVFLIFVENL